MMRRTRAGGLPQDSCLQATVSYGSVDGGHRPDEHQAYTGSRDATEPVPATFGAPDAARRAGPSSARRLPHGGAPPGHVEVQMTPRTFALRSSFSFRPWLTAAAVLSLATGMVFPVANVAAAAPGPHASAVALAAPAGSGIQKYIAILRNQNTTMAANSASRLSLIKAQQAPVLSRVRAAGGHVLSSTHLLNAVIATMTASQAAALAADPDVAEVVPDGVIPGPSPLASAPMGTSPSAKPSVALPSCGTPTAPELDPEALTNINAVQAQAL